MHISTLFALLTTALAAQLRPSTATDLLLDTLYLGYWDVNLTSARSAQGYEAQFTTAIYSGNPNRTIEDEWSNNPQSSKYTSSRNTHDFSMSVGGICGIGSAATIKQRVDIGGRDYWLGGTTNFTLKINPVTGRGGTASFRVNATLDDAAVDVCGRPLNHEPSL